MIYLAMPQLPLIQIAACYKDSLDESATTDIFGNDQGSGADGAQDYV